MLDSEMNENQKIGKQVLKAIQKKLDKRFNAKGVELLNLAYECSKVTSDYDDIAEKVKYLRGSMELKPALREFIRKNGNIEVKAAGSRVHDASPAPAASAAAIDMEQMARALADVIARDKGSFIRNSLLKDFKDVADKYMNDNYYPVQKRIEVKVETPRVSVNTQFKEVLHHEFETVLALVMAGKSPFLVGEAGTGKNVICEQVAKSMGLEFYFSNAVTQEYKLTGFTDANGKYHETQFYKAFRNGGVFMLDEIDASCPDALIVLNMALANRKFDFPAPIGRVDAHPDFHVIAAGNTFGLGADFRYSGRSQQDMASLDRFIPVEIDYDTNIEMSIAQNDSDLVDFVESLREQAERTQTTMLVTYRAIGNIVALKNSMPLPKIMKMCVVKNLQEDDVMGLLKGMDGNNPYVKAMRSIYSH